MFAGQSTPWVVAVKQLMDDPELAQRLIDHVAAAHDLLTPVSAQLLATTGREADLFSFEANPAKLGPAADATASIEGIALAQLGALLDLDQLGYTLASANPVALLGHSQGILGVHMAQAIIDAGSIEAARRADRRDSRHRRTHRRGRHPRGPRPRLVRKYGDATPMLSVKGILPAQADELIRRVDDARGPIAVAVINSANHVVLSGHPQDLASFAVEVAKEHKHQAQLRAEKVRGGSVFDPVLEYLEVTLPFHSPLMDRGRFEQAVAWAENPAASTPATCPRARRRGARSTRWIGARPRGECCSRRSTDPSARCGPLDSRSGHHRSPSCSPPWPKAPASACCGGRHRGRPRRSSATLRPTPAAAHPGLDAATHQAGRPDLRRRRAHRDRVHPH